MDFGVHLASEEGRQETSVFGLKAKAQRLLRLIEKNPYQTPPRYEKLVGDLAGAYSRRINIQHRLVYQVLDDVRVVKFIRIWTHYE